jgi:Y_Y_Y domain/Histidine kinase
VDSRQAVVSGAPACIQNGRVDALSVVHDAQPESPWIIPDFHLDPLRLRVTESIAQRLASNMRVPRAMLLDDAATAGPLREFGPADGIPAAEGVRRDRPVLADSAGRIWLSLRRGVYVVEPARLGSASVPAIVHLESVSADGNPLDPRAPLRLPPSSVRIRFDYRALSLSAPERVRYKYRLDNLDQRWSEPTSSREALYMNLPPGPYRFRVIASNSAGIWNSAEAEIDMQVVPGFTQTWTFRALVFVLCALAALVAYRLRVRRITKELNIGFEERLDERTLIAQELHDTLLQGLLATSMQLHIGVARLPPDSTALPQLTRVVAMLQQVITESRDALRGLRGSTSMSDDLEQALSKVRDELAVAESTDFRIIVDGPRRPLNPLIRDQVYRMGREGLSNAFRHSGAATVEIEIDTAAAICAWQSAIPDAASMNMCCDRAETAIGG